MPFTFNFVKFSSIGKKKSIASSWDVMYNMLTRFSATQQSSGKAGIYIRHTGSRALALNHYTDGKKMVREHMGTSEVTSTYLVRLTGAITRTSVHLKVNTLHTEIVQREGLQSSHCIHTRSDH